jgi:hypothetical protein
MYGILPYKAREKNPWLQTPISTVSEVRMMWIMLAGTPAPDSPYWPGREWFAAADAVVWPAVAVWCRVYAPFSAGLVTPVASALCGVVALLRLKTAWLSNRRYRFTTWRLGRVLILLLLLGFALNLAVWW